MQSSPRDASREQALQSVSIDTIHNSQFPFTNQPPSLPPLPSLSPSLHSSFSPSIPCLNLQPSEVHIGEQPIEAEVVSCIDRLNVPLHTHRHLLEASSCCICQCALPLSDKCTMLVLCNCKIWAGIDARFLDFSLGSFYQNHVSPLCC